MSASTSASKSTSQFTDSRVAAADQGTAVGAGGMLVSTVNTKNLGAGAINAGNRSTITVNDLSADVANTAITEMGRVSDGFITAGGAALNRAFEYGTTLFDRLGDMVESQSDLTLGNAAANASLLNAAYASNAKILDTITDLGKTTATGGQSDTNKTLLYVVLALGGLGIAGLFILRK